MKLTMKMEQWIEARLWNQKIVSDAITIKQIVSELANLFEINLTQHSQVQLESEIEKIRFRIYKRYERWLLRRTEWATKLSVPESMIQRWFRAGWIDPRKPETISSLTGMIIERDYYYRFIEPKDADDKIPEDPDISITSV